MKLLGIALRFSAACVIYSGARSINFSARSHLSAADPPHEYRTVAPYHSPPFLARLPLSFIPIVNVIFSGLKYDVPQSPGVQG